MDKTVDAFASEHSASGISKQSPGATKVIERVLIFVKYLSNFLHKGARIAINILNRGKCIRAIYSSAD